ncbi:hypothetical protein U27_03733 [Candidatus Vecturithrix granuli]|uniref:Uncharacterized protein n=1 Tax=Vecturithrix granuli TaxID=1499967 RepID=A0A081BWR4_VECG1|nr:hypothetical protein U27_03733 [Candidatus Vecturithrix granuli]
MHMSGFFKRKHDMDTVINDMLRTEISELRKLRHDLIMRKFAFLTAFMGTGAISIVSSAQASLNFSLLLFLVPFVAIAFDFYIFVEDYRIKRAGEFLKRLQNLPDISENQKIEGIWEEFVAENPDRGATFAFSVVTLIYAVSSLLLLIALKYTWWILTIWFIVAVLCEGAILLRHLTLREKLRKPTPNVDAMLARLSSPHEKEEDV